MKFKTIDGINFIEQIAENSEVTLLIKISKKCGDAIQQFIDESNFPPYSPSDGIDILCDPFINKYSTGEKICVYANIKLHTWTSEKS